MKKILSVCALSVCLTACVYSHDTNYCPCQNSCSCGSHLRQRTAESCVHHRPILAHPRKIIVVLPAKTVSQPKSVQRQEIIYPLPEPCPCQK